MSYRDDLEAAIAHAEAVERDLAAAREQNEHDHERIAELEKRLAAAQHDCDERRRRVEPARAKEPPPSGKSDSGRGSDARRVVLALLGIVGSIVACGLIPYLLDVATRLKTIEVTPGIAEATKVAAGYLPDPVLTSIRADYVDPRGVSDFATYDGKVTYGFTSPLRAAASPAVPHVPIGAPPARVTYPTCAVNVRCDLHGMHSRTIEALGAQCGEPLAHPPRCTMLDLWSEAFRRGALHDAVAAVVLAMSDLDDPDGKGSRRVPLWRFTIGDAQHTVFEMKIPDECPLSR